MDWQQILQLLNSGAQTVNSLVSNPTVRSLAGAGLVGAGLAQKETPGYANEAISYLRNRLAPTGIADQFSGQIGALNAEYLPYLEQQRKQILDAAQQRFIAGQPSSFSTAMSGPEIGRIRSAITNEILPAERAHLADIGQYLLSQGGSAAGTLLNYAKPDPLGEYLTRLGLGIGGFGGQGGQPGQVGTGAGSQLGQQLLSMFGGNTSIGDAISKAVGLANTSGDTSQLAALLSSGVLKGVPFPIGLQASTPAGQLIQQAINAGLVESPAAIPAGAAAEGGLASFLGSSLGTVLGLAGIAYGGYQLGGLASQFGQNQFQSSAGGALGGAAAGAAAGTLVFPGVGTAIGAVVGGLAGLFGGLFGERSQQQQQKAANLRADLDEQANYVFQIGTFFNQQLAALGVNTAAFQAFITQQVQASPGPGDEQGIVAAEGARLLLQAIQRTNPSITSLSQVPGLRQAFIDQMLGTVQNPANVSPFSAGNVVPYANLAGLARGGFISKPTNTLVGERGPELAHLTPGSYIVPLSPSMN